MKQEATTAEEIPDLDTFTAAYIEAALWSSMDETDDQTGGNPLDQNYSRDDIAPETLARMEADCLAFWREHRRTCLESFEGGMAGPAEYAGHDFWLTRNGHGSGFWDGGWEEEAGKILTDAAHAFGEYDLHVGDDGKIHGMKG